MTPFLNFLNLYLIHAIFGIKRVKNENEKFSHISFSKNRILITNKIKNFTLRLYSILHNSTFVLSRAELLPLHLYLIECENLSRLNLKTEKCINMFLFLLDARLTMKKNFKLFGCCGLTLK